MKSAIGSRRYTAKMDRINDDVALARRIVRRYLPADMAAIVLFGSRARGDARRFSDIDLAVIPKQPVARGQLAALREALEDSSMLVEVDVVDFREAGEELRAAIEREGVAWID